MWRYIKHHYNTCTERSAPGCEARRTDESEALSTQACAALALGAPPQGVACRARARLSDRATLPEQQPGLACTEKSGGDPGVQGHERSPPATRVAGPTNGSSWSGGASGVCEEKRKGRAAERSAHLIDREELLVADRREVVRRRLREVLAENDGRGEERPEQKLRLRLRGSRRPDGAVRAQDVVRVVVAARRSRIGTGGAARSRPEAPHAPAWPRVVSQSRHDVDAGRDRGPAAAVAVDAPRVPERRAARVVERRVGRRIPGVPPAGGADGGGGVC